MEQRKLDVSEHGRTRSLWEEVFSEDTKTFLDYYYFLKTRDNEIYVIDEDGETRSMLHLNPYRLQVEKERFQAHYIVGVATKEEYRGRGYMRRLLLQAMEEMYRRREWFTFLMPAAEEIYTPYDFQFVYAQEQSMLRILEHTETIETAKSPGQAELIHSSEMLRAAETVTCMDATLGDAGELADFFETQSVGRWQVYTVRDEQYYQRQILEQQSENGGIRILRAQGRIVGSFLYSREGDTEVLEPLYLPEYETCFQKAVRELAGDGQKTVKLYAANQPDSKPTPLIMARVLHPESILAAMRVKEGCTLNCSFAVLDTFLLQNNRIWRISSAAGDDSKVHVQETEDSEGVLPIAALTCLLFGSRTIADIEHEDGVIMSPHLKEELAKLQPLSGVFLNEIV